MSATFHRFRSRGERQKIENRLLLADLLRGMPVERGPPSVRVATKVLQAHLEGHSAAKTGWEFIMVSPAQNLFVVDHLSRRSRRKVVALKLWALCISHVLRDTGEIVFTRSDLARELGIDAAAVSRIMGELASIGAVSFLRDGRGVRYFLNPNVGTHLPGPARAKAQAEFGPLRVVPL